MLNPFSRIKHKNYQKEDCCILPARSSQLKSRSLRWSVDHRRPTTARCATTRTITAAAAVATTSPVPAPPPRWPPSLSSSKCQCFCQSFPKSPFINCPGLGFLQVGLRRGGGGRRPTPLRRWLLHAQLAAEAAHGQVAAVHPGHVRDPLPSTNLHKFPSPKDVPSTNPSSSTPSSRWTCPRWRSDFT